MPGQLQSVVSLHKTNAELVDAKQRLEGIPDWMTELHGEHSTRQTEIDGVAAKRDEAAKARRGAEAALTDAQEKAKHYQSQISQVSTQREYTALLKEIDTVKALINDLEKTVLESIEIHDQAEKELTSLDESFKELNQRYKKELAKWEAEKPAIADRVEILSREVEEMRANLPRPFLNLFDRVYGRHGVTAISRIVKIQTMRGGNPMWHCEDCSYNVRPQILIEIRNDGTIIQCDSCKRILYIEDEE